MSAAAVSPSSVPAVARWAAELDHPGAHGRLAEAFAAMAVDEQVRCVEAMAQTLAWMFKHLQKQPVMAGLLTAHERMLLQDAGVVDLAPMESLAFYYAIAGDAATALQFNVEHLLNRVIALLVESGDWARLQAVPASGAQAVSAQVRERLLGSAGGAFENRGAAQHPQLRIKQ